MLTRRTRATAIVATVGLTLLIPSAMWAQGGGQPPTSPVSGDAGRGRQLYYDYACYACHGYTGETGARPLVGTWPPTLATEDVFIRFLRGRATISPELPSTRMPSYAERTLSDRQAKDIYAYIRTFRSHAPPLEQIDVMKRILDAASKR
jgi:mono/diheme cytochrome c family protein